MGGVKLKAGLPPYLKNNTKDETFLAEVLSKKDGIIWISKLTKLNPHRPYNDTEIMIWYTKATQTRFSFNSLSWTK